MGFLVNFHEFKYQTHNSLSGMQIKDLVVQQLDRRNVSQENFNGKKKEKLTISEFIGFLLRLLQHGFDSKDFYQSILEYTESLPFNTMV